jgi:hypothetical protein
VQVRSPSLEILGQAVVGFVVACAVPVVFGYGAYKATHHLLGWGIESLVAGIAAGGLAVMMPPPLLESRKECGQYVFWVAIAILGAAISGFVTWWLTVWLLGWADWKGLGLGAIVGYLAFDTVRQLYLVPGPVPPVEYIRGAFLQTLEQAAAVARHCLPAGDAGLFLGGLLVPTRSEHTVIMGATSSGKTMTFRLLFQGLVRLAGVNALVMNAKNEWLPLLYRMVDDVGRKILYINPLDARTVAWDVAKDVQTPNQALQLSSLIFEKPENDRAVFWASVGQDIVCGVILSLMELLPGAWDFRLLVRILGEEELLLFILKQTRAGRRRLRYFTSGKTGPDFMPTLMQQVAPFVVVGDAFARAKERISLRDWVESEDILVLGTHEEARPAIDAINRVMFRFVSQLILERPNVNVPRHIFALDEVREAGNLGGSEGGGLRSLALKGRSKGLCLILAMQDRSGFLEEYGEKEGEEILAQMSHRVALRLKSPETMQWWSDIFGEEERYLWLQSIGGGDSSDGKSSQNHSVRQTVEKRPIVSPTDIGDMAPTSPETGLPGFYLSPMIGAWQATLPWDLLMERLLPPHPDVAELVPWSLEEQQPLEWSEEDSKRIGFSAPATERKKAEREAGKGDGAKPRSATDPSSEETQTPKGGGRFHAGLEDILFGRRARAKKAAEPRKPSMKPEEGGAL